MPQGRQTLRHFRADRLRIFRPTLSRRVATSVPAPVISYAGSPFSWTFGVAIATANVSSTGGTVTSYAVTSGTLPTGISLNTSTGALTGTPTVAQTAASVTITATGPGGTSDAIISVAVWGLLLLGTKLKEWEYAGGTLWQDSARTTAVTANNDPVGAMDDLSTGGNHLLQGTAGARPTYKTGQINSRPALSFDGGDFLKMAGAIASVAQPVTRWVVMRFTGTPPAATEVILEDIGANNTRFSRNITTGFLVLRSATALTTDDTDDGASWHLYQVTFNGGSSALFKDGTSIHTGNAGAAGFTGTSMGATAAGASFAQNGTLIAEHFVTAGEDATDITNIKAYVAARYGLTLA